MTIAALLPDDSTLDIAVAAYAILSLKGIGTVAARKMWDSTESGSAHFTAIASDPVLAAEVLGPDRADQLPEAWDIVAQQVEAARLAGFSFFHIDDPKYPKSLRRRLGDHAPLIISAQGNFELFGRSGVSFCGSRQVSDKGKHAAELCSAALSYEGLNVISGYAKGVDETTHREALLSNGTTTIVMPEGCNNFRVKRSLRDVWDWDRILVVSEFSPGARWTVSRAMERNSTICSLSEAMILIEAKSKGGSYQAGLDCLKRDIDLYAINFDVTDEGNRGNQELIDQGAIPLGMTRKSGQVRPLIDKVLMSIKEANQPITYIEEASQLNLL